MTRYVLLILFLVCNSAMADEHCIKPKMNYERDCAAVKNLNNLPSLKNINDCAILTIDSRSHWNASGLRLEKGGKYQLSVSNKEQWCDANIVTDYQGWQVSDAVDTKRTTCPDGCGKCKNAKAVQGPLINHGKVLNALFDMGGIWRRHEKSRYFALIGMLKGELYSEDFNVSKRASITPKADAEFCAYANDLSFFYGNNSGTLQLTITRLK